MCKDNYIYLIDTNGSVDFHINEFLVDQGLAKSAEESFQPITDVVLHRNEQIQLGELEMDILNEKVKKSEQILFKFLKELDRANIAAFRRSSKVL